MIGGLDDRGRDVTGVRASQARKVFAQLVCSRFVDLRKQCKDSDERQSEPEPDRRVEQSNASHGLSCSAPKQAKLPLIEL
jgi:hypothetical protein